MREAAGRPGSSYVVRDFCVDTSTVTHKDTRERVPQTLKCTEGCWGCVQSSVCARVWWWVSSGAGSPGRQAQVAREDGSVLPLSSLPLRVLLVHVHGLLSGCLRATSIAGRGVSSSPLSVCSLSRGL